jgi:hypothetical protein
MVQAEEGAKQIMFTNVTDQSHIGKLNAILEIFGKRN